MEWTDSLLHALAVDLAKSVYKVSESVRSGQVLQRKRLNREAFRRYIQEQAEPVEWVMEACGTAHDWVRHRVTLIHVRYVRPYRRRNKTDCNDCDAMLEAARCKDIYPVPVKPHEQQLKCWHADDEVVRKLDEVSGIGLLTASALTAAVGKPERFASGRQLSAWLGMTPNEYSSGERRRLGRISCKGNIYVCTLFIHGSRAALLAAQRCQARTHAGETDRITVETAARIGHNKAAVALANKLVRICWAVWCHERRFNGNWQSTKPA